jgi:hypothetical protein
MSGSPALHDRSDNPSYDVDARPAPPLKKVIDEVGDC